jgi:hypothetical protein
LRRDAEEKWKELPDQLDESFSDDDMEYGTSKAEESHKLKMKFYPDADTGDL